jgi:hypothetical protein
VLDQRYPSRVDDRSAEAVARLAREQRGVDLEDAAPPIEHEDAAPPIEHEDASAADGDVDGSTRAEGESK